MLPKLIVASILFALLYWLFLTILLPKWGGYRLEEETDVLADGTAVTKLVHAPLDQDT